MATKRITEIIATGIYDINGKETFIYKITCSDTGSIMVLYSAADMKMKTVFDTLNGQTTTSEPTQQKKKKSRI